MTHTFLSLSDYLAEDGCWYVGGAGLCMFSVHFHLTVWAEISTLSMCVHLCRANIHCRWWMDCFRLSDRIVDVGWKKENELIITMAELMSRGAAALTFSSLSLATIKKMYQGGDNMSGGVFVFVWQCAHWYVCARLWGSDMKQLLKAEVNGLTVACSWGLTLANTQGESSVAESTALVLLLNN